MILDYILPDRVFARLKGNITELKNFSKFKKIILGLQQSGRLEQLGLSVDRDGNLYLGINLNPELLMYSDTSQTSVELKLISEKMNKYNDFLTKEGILDSIKVDYDRVLNDDYYGYILRISYSFTRFRKSDFVYDIAYFSVLAIIFLVAVWNVSVVLL